MAKNLTPFPHFTQMYTCYYPPLHTYSCPSAPSISNRNLFKYPINNFIEKKMVKTFTDRKIIIANAL